MAFFLMGYPHGSRQIHGLGRAYLDPEPWLTARCSEAGLSELLQVQPGTRRSCQRPRCLVKLAPGRAWEGPLTAWNQEEDLLFRYWKCSVDVCSAHIEDVVVLTDVGRIETTFNAKGKIVPWAPRYGLARVLEAEAIDPEVTLYLAGWGLPVDSDVLVAQLPEVLVELVTQRMWHTVMWRWTYPGGLLLQNVFDLIPVHMQRNAMVRRKARRGHPIDPRQPDPKAAPVAREFFRGRCSPVAAMGPYSPGRTGQRSARG